MSKGRPKYRARDVLDAYNAFAALSPRPVGETPEDEELSFCIARMLRQIRPEAEAIQGRLAALMRECGAETEGQGLVFTKLEEEDDFRDRSEAIEEAKIPLNIEPLTWEEARVLKLSIGVLSMTEGILFVREDALKEEPGDGE